MKLRQRRRASFRRAPPKRFSLFAESLKAYSEASCEYFAGLQNLREKFAALALGESFKLVKFGASGGLVTKEYINPERVVLVAGIDTARGGHGDEYVVSYHDAKMLRSTPLPPIHPALIDRDTE